MTEIINCTQHLVTTSQENAGVVNFPKERRDDLYRLLTFTQCPTVGEVAQRAEQICNLIEEVCLSLCPAVQKPLMGQKVMIGGFMPLMSHLETALQERGATPVYSFTLRESVDEVNPETGAVIKRSVFNHVGFVEARRAA